VDFLQSDCTSFSVCAICSENLKIDYKIGETTMTLEFSHKPNYFMFAQLLIRHVENYINKHPEAENATFDLRDIYDLFRQDKASATTNLDGIMNIVDEYMVETLNGDERLISKYSIDVGNNSLLIDFNSTALESLKNGKQVIAPDATIQQ